MKKITFLCVSGILLLLSSCSDINESFTNGYYKNLNDPTSAPVNNLFRASESAFIALTEGHVARLSSMWVQNSTGETRQYAGYYNYNITSRGLDLGFAWEHAYTGVLANGRLAMEQAENKGNQENSIAVLKIIEAMTMGTVTALWGDVPYSDMLNPEKTSTPKLDKQTKVYSSIQDLLSQAIQTLEQNPQNLVQGLDIFSYKGDVNKWIKLAYSMKARFYMETGNYDEAISAAQNGIQTLDGSEDLYFLHGTTYNGNMNMWYSFMLVDRNGYLGASENHTYPLMKKLENSKTNETGRINFYYENNGTELNTTGSGMFATDAKYRIFTAAENYLILAEASIRKGTNQGKVEALKYLNKARSYNEHRFSGSTYKPLNLADFQSGGIYANKTIKQEIFDETYLSLAFQIEDFNFCRRIHYQVTGLKPVPGHDKFPQRLLYPNNEKRSNPNIPKQTSADLFKPTPVNQ